MKKLLIAAITLFLIISFSSVAWCSSVIGDWDVAGKLSMKIKVDGEGSEKEKGYAYDWLTFYSNGYFDTYDFDGSWLANSKGKFTVDMYDDTIEEFFEDIFYDALGIYVNVDVEQATLSGKMKASRDRRHKSTIKGKYKIKVTFYNSFYNLYGSIQMQYKFAGIRFYPSDLVNQSIPSDKISSSELESDLSEMIQEVVNETTLSE